MQVDAKHAMPRHDNANARPAVMGAHELPANMRKIFVGGLPASVVDSSLRQHFERYGAVEDAVVMIDHQSKRPRGFGFVTFADEKSLDNVLKYDTRQTLHGKEVEIKRAVPRDQLQQNSPRSSLRMTPRGYDMRSLPFPPRFPPGAPPYGYNWEAHQQMERQLHAFYTGRLLDNDLTAQMLHAPMMRMDANDAMPSGMQWPPAPADVPSEASEAAVEDAWARHSALPARNGHDLRSPAMQNVGNLPMYGLQSEPDHSLNTVVDTGDNMSHSKSQPVSFIPQRKPQHSQSYGANGIYSNTASGTDAFENLASSLGASLPLSGSTMFGR